MPIYVIIRAYKISCSRGLYFTKEKDMKKRLFFIAIMIIAVVTLLSITVNAEASAFSYDTGRTVKLDNGTTVELYDESGNALTWYFDGAELKSTLTTEAVKWDGSGWLIQNSVTPSTIVVLNLQDPTLDATASGNYGFNIDFRHSTNLEYVFFSNVVKKFNGSYIFSNCDKLKVFEITENSSIESFSQYMFYDCAVLGELHIPKGVVSFPSSNDESIGFASKCPLLKKVTFSPSATLKTITKAAFAYSGVEEVTIPDTVTKIEPCAFRQTKIVNSPLTENSQCETIGYYCFRDCDYLKTFIIPATFEKVDQSNYMDYGIFSECAGIDKVIVMDGITSLPNYLFSKANVKEIILPEGLTSIGNHFCNENKTLESIKIPNSVKTIGERAFQNCSALKKIIFGNGLTHFVNSGTDNHSLTYNTGGSITEVYLPLSFYKTAPSEIYRVSYAFEGLSANSIIFYCGDQAQLTTAITNFKTATTNATEKDSNAKFLNATQVDYNTYIEDIKTTPDKYSKGNYIVYNYNTCDAFYDKIHGYDTDCTTADACKNGCGLTNTKNESHNNGETLTFANGLTAEGVHSVGCKNDGCSVKTEETVKPVFVAKGYSTNDDKNAINGGYEVNPTSLTLYERLIGELKYGIIIANANSFGEKTFLDENNKVNSDKALQVEMDKQYASFDCSINFGTNTDIDLDLVICAYVIEGDTVTYIQSSTGDDVTIGGESFKSVTLAQVVALVPAASKEN